MTDIKIGSVGRLGIYLTDSPPALGVTKPPTTMAYVYVDVPFDDTDAYHKHWNPLGHEVAKYLSDSLSAKGYVFEQDPLPSNKNLWRKFDLGEEIRYAGITNTHPDKDADGFQTIVTDPNQIMPRLLKDSRDVLKDFKNRKGLGGGEGFSQAI